MSQHGDLNMCMAHVIPGLLMIAIAFWWTVNLLLYKESTLQSVRFYFLGPCCQFPVESVFKIVVAVGGIVNEISLRYLFPIVRLNDSQHLAMLLMFGLLGVVELLRHFRFDVPKGTERVTYMIFSAVSAVAFLYHDKADAPLGNLMHRLLVYVNVASILCSFFELQNPQLVVLALGRSYLMLLQGTWFLQLGLYFATKGSWEESNPEHRLYFCVFFIWHIVLDFVLTLVAALCVKLRCRKETVTTSEKKLMIGNLDLDHDGP